MSTNADRSTDRMNTSTGTGQVWLVGAGPGDPGYITVAGMNALRRAEVAIIFCICAC